MISEWRGPVGMLVGVAFFLMIAFMWGSDFMCSKVCEAAGKPLSSSSIDGCKCADSPQWKKP